MANEIDIDGLSISIEVNSEKAAQGLDNVAKSAKNAKKAISNINAGKALGNINKEATDSTKALKDLENRMGDLFSKGQKAGKNFFNIDNLGIPELKGKLQSLTNQYNKAMDTINTKMVSGILGGKTFDNAVISAGKLATRMDIVRDKIEAIQTAQNTSGAKDFWETDGWYEKKNAIQEVATSYEDLYGKTVKLEGSTLASTMNQQKQATAETDTEVKKLANDTMSMGEAWKNTFGFIGQSVKNLPKNLFGAISDKISAIKDKLSSIKVKGLFSGLKGKFSDVITESDASNVSKRASKIASALKKLGGFALKNLSGFTLLKGGFNKLREAGKHLSKSLSRVSKMFSLMLLRMALRKVIDGIKTGFQNLAQYSDSVRVSISKLKDSLSYLGNSFAAAFAPVINIVAPILSAFIDYLVNAINAINQLISSLLGFSTWTKATKLAQNYGKAVSGAGKAAKELNKQLQGFDELNNLTTNDGAGGGGGSGSATNYADMFTTEEVDGYWKTIAERIKDSWNFDDADFTWLGNSLGTKISQQLDGLIEAHPTIKNNARKAGKAIGTLITGFVEVPELGYKTGLVIANAIDVGVSGLNGFVKNVHWDSVGKFIGDGINGIKDSELIGDVFELLKNVINGGIDLFLNTGKTIDFKGLGEKIGTELSNKIKELDTAELGEAFSVWVKGALMALTSFFTSIDYEDVGKKIAEFINNIDFGGIAISFLNLAGAILEGIVTSIKSLWINGDALTKIGLVVAGLIGLAKISGITLSLAGATVSATGASLGGIISQACNAWFGTNPLTVAVSVVVAWSLGEGLGKSLGAEIFAEITDDPEIYQYYKEFHWFGKGGFFEEISDDWSTTKQAMCEMLDDIDTYWENTSLYKFFHGEEGSKTSHFGHSSGEGYSGSSKGKFGQGAGGGISFDYANDSLNRFGKTADDNFNKVSKGYKSLTKEVNKNTISQVTSYKSGSTSMQSLSTNAKNSFSDVEKYVKQYLNFKEGKTNIASLDTESKKAFSQINQYLASTGMSTEELARIYGVQTKGMSTNTKTLETNLTGSAKEISSSFATSKSSVSTDGTSMSSGWFTNVTKMYNDTVANTNNMTNNLTTWSSGASDIVNNTTGEAKFGVSTPTGEDVSTWWTNLKNIWQKPTNTEFGVETPTGKDVDTWWTNLKNIWQKPVEAKFGVEPENGTHVNTWWTKLSELWKDKDAKFNIAFGADASSTNSIFSSLADRLFNAFSSVPLLSNIAEKIRNKIRGYAKGGVFDEATLGVFGEAGTEAVVPLERNTKWLGKMSTMLLDEMQNREFTLPTPTTSYSNVSSSNGLYSSIDNSSAIAEQNTLLKEQNQLLRQIASKDVSINSRDIFNAVRNENNDYVNRTGISAFVM